MKVIIKGPGSVRENQGGFSQPSALFSFEWGTLDRNRLVAEPITKQCIFSK